MAFEFLTVIDSRYGTLLVDHRVLRSDLVLPAFVRKSESKLFELRKGLFLTD